jgi:hypothetical protein
MGLVSSAFFTASSGTGLRTGDFCHELPGAFAQSSQGFVTPGRCRMRWHPEPRWAAAALILRFFTPVFERI